MEGLTRLVAESLARNGFDRPVDYRRLRWSRWFRCESHRSLLFVPSKPGVFALAEEIMDFGKADTTVRQGQEREGHDFTRTEKGLCESADSAAEGRRMLAVTQFYEDDDMAFVLGRMLSYQNPMRVRLASGRYFVRFVVVEDSSQRRSICSALNQWMISAAEKATGIGSHFADSLELSPEDAGRASQAPSLAMVDTISSRVEEVVADNPAKPVPPSVTALHLDSGAARNVHCPPFPSGF